MLGQLLCGINAQKPDIAHLESWTRRLGRSAELVFVFLFFWCGTLMCWMLGREAI